LKPVSLLNGHVLYELPGDLATGVTHFLFFTVLQF